MDVQVTVDGSCTRRKRMSVGCVIRELHTNKLLEASYLDLAGRGTNNIAEYRAIINACTRVRAYAPGRVVVYTDSQLVLRQLQGEYRVNDVKLRNEHELACAELKKVNALVRWHKRDDGDGPLADALANRSKRMEVTGGNDAHVNDGSGRAGSNDNGFTEAPRAEIIQRGQCNSVENAPEVARCSQCGA